MGSTPKFGLVTFGDSKAGAEVFLNENTIALENGISALSVKDRDLATAPASPADGDCHIINGTPAGDWATATNKAAADGDVAIYRNGWTYYTPKDGLTARVQDEDIDIRYDEEEAEWYLLNGSTWPSSETYMGWKTPSGNKVYRNSWRDLGGPAAATPTVQAHGVTMDWTDDAKAFGTLRLPGANAAFPIPIVTVSLWIVDIAINATSIIVATNVDFSTYKVDIFFEYTK